jgi:two-component system, NarL family, response regulator DevR
MALLEDGPGDTAPRLPHTPALRDVTRGHGEPPVRVLVVDGHEVVRWGLRSVLTQAGLEVVGQAGEGSEALALVDTVEPDVVVIEVHLPDESGIEVARRIRRRRPTTRCVVLTSHEGVDAYHSSMLAGAAAYLLKSAPPDDIVATIREVAAGTSPIERFVPWPGRHHPEPQEGRADRLTPQERRIASLVADGLSNREIAERLFLAEKTVRNRVSVILEKLHVRNRTELAVHVAQRRRPLGHRPDR